MNVSIELAEVMVNYLAFWVIVLIVAKVSGKAGRVLALSPVIAIIGGVIAIAMSEVFGISLLKFWLVLA